MSHRITWLHLLFIVTAFLLIIDITYNRHPCETQNNLRQDPKDWIDPKALINSADSNDPIDTETEVPTITFHRPLHCVPDVPCKYPDRVDLRIIVIVYDRAESMLKLLRSLDNLILDEASASLEIWIDQSKHNEVHGPTLEAAQQFNWSKGKTRVHVQDRHVGIYGQWIDTWQPNNTDELALILEDDISVSPYAWRWLRAAHQRFGSRTDILGYTLQSEHVNTAIGERRLMVSMSQNVFLNRQMGSWGFSPHPAVWADFQKWYHNVRKDPAIHPYVGGGVVFDSWYRNFEKQGTTDSMWTIWFIKYTNERNLYCVYNNLVKYSGKRQAMLGVHRREKGLHSTGPRGVSKKKNLLITWSDSYIQFPKKVQRFEFNGDMSLVKI